MRSGSGGTGFSRKSRAYDASRVFSTRSNDEAPWNTGFTGRRAAPRPSISSTGTPRLVNATTSAELFSVKRLRAALRSSRG